MTPAIPLGVAVICLDCESIYCLLNAMRCPRCTSAYRIPLARIVKSASPAGAA